LWELASLEGVTPDGVTSGGSVEAVFAWLGDRADPRTVETHVSVLFFTPDRVYKLKKAVDLGFVDFTSRAARRAACQAEVDLNRRLAPDVYLGVADVPGPAGAVCDHVVAMRRMPADRRLSTLVRQGGDLTGEIRAAARLIAAFHSRCVTSAEIAQAGSPAAVRALWEEGVAGLAPFRGRLLDASVVDEIGRLASRYLDGRGALLAERQRAGQVRDGHGDLLADDLYCLADGPRVLDCLEFDRRLRWGDVLGDVAFLAMDLERLGAPELAGEFLRGYTRFAGEIYPPSLRDFYIAYRAFVRCKVACLRYSQGDDATVEARSLAALAVEHLRTARVRLVLVGGLPGTGKSTLAAALVDRVDGWVLLRTDLVRKELSAGSRLAAAGAQYRTGIYSPTMTDQTYAEVLSRAECALARGETVVLDASWADTRHRDDAARLAARTAADLVELRCVASPSVAASRIARRAVRGGDPSDATDRVHRAMAATFPPWTAATPVMTAVPRAEWLRAAAHAVA
jgi:uncharacterized protein